jgi:hypothetical protein
MSAIQRRFALLLGACLAMAAFAMPASASAEVLPVEVHNEAGEVCNSVQLVGSTVSGGCELEFSSDGVVGFTDGKKTLLACEVGMDLQVDPNGWGYTSNMYVSPGHSTCGFSPRPCFSGGKAEPQEIQMAYSEEEGYFMDTNLCFGDSSGNKMWGTVKMLLNQGELGITGSTPQTLLENTTVPGGFKLGLTAASWDFAGEDIEIIAL